MQNGHGPDPFLAVPARSVLERWAMRRSEDTVQTSLAWAKALRAAALLLNREVCRYVMACRADLPAAHRRHLERLSWRAWKEASALYGPNVWPYFEIDETELRRRALNLARL